MGVAASLCPASSSSVSYNSVRVFEKMEGAASAIVGWKDRGAGDDDKATFLDFFVTAAAVTPVAVKAATAAAFCLLGDPDSSSEESASSGVAVVCSASMLSVCSSSMVEQLSDELLSTPMLSKSPLAVDSWLGGDEPEMRAVFSVSSVTSRAAAVSKSSSKPMSPSSSLLRLCINTWSLSELEVEFPKPSSNSVGSLFELLLSLLPLKPLIMSSASAAMSSAVSSLELSEKFWRISSASLTVDSSRVFLLLLAVSYSANPVPFVACGCGFDDALLLGLLLELLEPLAMSESSLLYCLIFSLLGESSATAAILL
mmetsp:Transcript_4846/g.11560  ORF Transcript_4846/g.11560 Transcript_4846/m.11560 type:complete len:313 (+) Transcript_4846:1722-2660(+)